ncbi:ABC transporter ATP-binding protein [Flavobacterium sp.]|uniref:ABC transporter ATP-binding protein n=1 Tax=Flavobacterium sp. TaxID=239 RepID=UPI0026083EF6|nr:ABC transporter ATP-binding protein [Flavobacterium sp.]
MILLISVFYSLIDALSLTIFIPLFQIASGEDTGSVSQKTSYFIRFFEWIGLQPNVNSVLLLMIFFFSLKALFRYVDVFYRVLATSYFIKRIRHRLLEAIANVEYAKFVTLNYGTIQNTVTGEILNVNNAFAQYISVIQNLIFVFVYLLLSFLTNPKFTLIVIVGGWLSRWVFKSLYKSSETLSLKITHQNNELSGLVLQKTGNYKYLKSTALLARYLSKINDKVNAIEKQVVVLGKNSAKVMAFREPIIVLFLVLAIFIQMNILGGKFNAIIVILLFFYRAFGSLMSVQQSWTAFLKYVGSVNHYESFLDELKTNAESTQGNSFQSFEKSVSLSNVSFAYQNGKSILNAVNLTIPKNNSIAIVGKSGSGKTTLVNLICGLLKPSTGEIVVDGQPLRTINLASFRQKIGFIAQETVVFNDTLFNNVTFWDEKNEYNVKRFNEAIKKVDLEAFMQRSENGADTILGDSGVVMSGGQRQRLSIARELYKNIEILILDEATSALDSQTEKFIQESIENLKGQLTIIIIAHRLSTIKHADTIVLLKDGEVEASGNYQELLQKSATFAQMVALQEL